MKRKNEQQRVLRRIPTLIRVVSGFIILLISLFILAYILGENISYFMNKQQIQAALNEQCIDFNIVVERQYYDTDPFPSWSNSEAYCYQYYSSDGWECSCYSSE